MADELLAVCRPLVRAAYLGTLLAAVTLGRPRVVLTLIGGGAFGNPIPLIWQSILWASSEVQPLLWRDLDVVLNGRNLGRHIDRLALVEGACHWRGAVLAGTPTDRRK